MAWATGPLPHYNPTCSCESTGFFLGSQLLCPATVQKAAYFHFWAVVQSGHQALGVGRQGSRDLVQPDCPLPTAWQQVEQQLGGGPAGESSPRPVQYVERTPNPRLQSEPSPTLRETPPLPAIVTWALPGSSPRAQPRGLEPEGA